MIQSKPGIILPQKYFNNIQGTYLNETDEVMFVKFNTLDRTIDPSVLDIVNDKDNKIYIPQHLAKSILIDAEIVHTSSKSKLADYKVILNSDLQSIKIVTIGTMIDFAPTELKKYLQELLDFDLITLNHFVEIPYVKYRYGRSNEEWYTYSKLTSKCNLIYAYVSNPNEKIIDLKSVVHYSNNRPLKSDDLTKIKRLLKNEDTYTLALEIMNLSNPEISFIELMIAFNEIPSNKKQKNKKQILPLMQELYSIVPTQDPFKIDSILNLYKVYFEGDLNEEQLEFIVDNYVSVYTEHSNYFNFKITKK